MLTAKGDTGDRVQGLELGCGRLYCKAVRRKELIARIKAVLVSQHRRRNPRTISLPG
ncbi:MAG: hypothetical protein R2912_12485 [Eubacteriales bacterium]